MLSYLKQIKQLVTVHPVFAVCILYIFFATALSRCCVFDACKFIFAQVAFIYIPGYVFQCLTGICYQNKLIRGIVSYATGYALSILVYLVLLIMSLHHYVIYVYAFIFLISIFVLFKLQPTEIDGCSESNEEKNFSFILLISLCISCLFFQCANLSPLLKEGNVTFNQDLVFWMRNAVAATKCYPLPEMSVMGKDFFYHYFTSIEIAFLHFTTNIEILDLCFTYSYQITIFLVVSGLYIICRSLISQVKIALIALCFILFTTNLELYTHIFLSNHIFTSSFGLAEGVAFFCFTLFYYLRLLKGDEKRNYILLITFLFFIVSTGLKGPIAAILLIGIAAGSLYLMFFKQQFVFGMLSGLLLLFAFLICLSSFVMNINGSAEEPGSSSALSVSLVNTIFHSHYYERIYFDFTNVGIPQLLSYLLILFLYLISVFLIPLGLTAIFKKREIVISDILLIPMIISGILLGLFVSQSGMSQMYFLFASIICLFLLTFSSFSLKKEDSLSYNKLKIIFLIGAFLFLYNNYGSGLSGIIGYVHSIKKEKTNSAAENVETGMTINHDEIVGLRWCRENLPQNSILLSNKVLAEGGARSFWSSSLSERQMFLESYDYTSVGQKEIKQRCSLIRRFYNGDNLSLSVLKSMGVAYAIIYKHISPHWFPNEGKIEFENTELMIVKL